MPNRRANVENEKQYATLRARSDARTTSIDMTCERHAMTRMSFAFARQWEVLRTDDRERFESSPRWFVQRDVAIRASKVQTDKVVEDIFR